MNMVNELKKLTTVGVSYDTLNILVAFKDELGCHSLDETIVRSIEYAQKFCGTYLTEQLEIFDKVNRNSGLTLSNAQDIVYLKRKLEQLRIEFAKHKEVNKNE